MRIPSWLMPVATMAAGSGAWAMAADEGAGLAMQPGEWEITFETLNVSGPNLPPELRDILKRPAEVSRRCLSAEEAKGPKPDSREGCTQEGFTWSGGRVSGTTTCTGASAGGGKSVVAMDGEYGPTRLRIDMKTSMEWQDSSLGMEMRITGRRLGDCPKSEEDS